MVAPDTWSFENFDSLQDNWNSLMPKQRAFFKKNNNPQVVISIIGFVLKLHVKVHSKTGRNKEGLQRCVIGCNSSLVWLILGICESATRSHRCDSANTKSSAKIRVSFLVLLCRHSSPDDNFNSMLKGLACASFTGPNSWNLSPSKKRRSPQMYPNFGG